MKRVLLERTSRTKLVNFRLSEDEAAYLIEKADASGARSVSEYVRMTALDVAERSLRKRDSVQALVQAQGGVISADENVSLRLLFVLRALEEALREARRGIVKD